MNQRVIERNELYKKVWKTPVTKLAAEYGISDVALKKICKKLNVPTPPLGYWAKVKNGVRTDPPPKLPTIERNAPHTHALMGRNSRRNDSDDSLNTIETPTINPSKALRNSHPLIYQTRQSFNDKYPTEYGLIKPSKDGLYIYVGPDSIKRALLIMDGLIKGIEFRGNQVLSCPFGTEPRTIVKMGKEIISIKLKEKSRMVTKALTKRELSFYKRYPPKNRLDRYRSIPDGTLCLSIESDVSGRKTWYDSKNKRLEEMLGSFYAGMLSKIPELRKRRLQKEEFARRMHHVEDMKRQYRIESDRLNKLENTSEQWDKRIKIERLVRNVESFFLNQSLSKMELAKLRVWIDWARDHARRLCPIDSCLPFDISAPPRPDKLDLFETYDEILRVRDNEI